MKEIYRAENPPLAHLLCGVLASHGIAAEVTGELLFGMRGDLPLDTSTLPAILVPDDTDVPAALALIEEYLRSVPSSPETGPEWRCECGETSGGQFSSCWRCGAPRTNAGADQSPLSEGSSGTP